MGCFLRVVVTGLVALSEYGYLLPILYYKGRHCDGFSSTLQSCVSTRFLLNKRNPRALHVLPPLVKSLDPVFFRLTTQSTRLLSLKDRPLPLSMQLSILFTTLTLAIPLLASFLPLEPRDAQAGVVGVPCPIAPPEHECQFLSATFEVDPSNPGYCLEGPQEYCDCRGLNSPSGFCEPMVCSEQGTWVRMETIGCDLKDVP